jgi:formate dehydrogenase major subunit
MVEAMPSLKNISWDRLVREESVTYPVDGPDVPGNEILFAEGFPTNDGRAHIVPAGLVPPDEVPDADYPLVLTTGRMLEHWHTGAMTRRSRVLDNLEPEAVASLNPHQLRTMGLEPGDMVKVATRRGEIALNVRADRDVPEGMVFIPFCFNEAAANMLTNPQLDPFGKIPEFKFCACKVEPLKTAAAAE